MSQIFFEALHTTQHSLAEVTIEGDDFEPISLEAKLTSSSMDSEEEDFEPIKINQVSATAFSTDLVDLIAETIGSFSKDTRDGLLEVFAM